MSLLLGHKHRHGEDTVLEVTDDIARETYCILGMPLDVIEMSAVLRKVDTAVAENVSCVISTPNINFLINCRHDPQFRESVLDSDLCPADGATLVWVARLVGIPIKHRVAGSDIFDALRTRPSSGRPLRVFLFGSTDDVAAAAAAMLNANSPALTCVGWLCPGFGTIEELSTDDLIEKINASRADFLVVALGAQKGQLWLQRNHHRLRIPIRSHLGAVINFQAGAVKRAPPLLRKIGLEWLWRIKEEPHLWRRYLDDGFVLSYLLVTRLVPLALETRLRQQHTSMEQDLIIEAADNGEYIQLDLSGFAVTQNVERALASLRKAIGAKKPIVINLAQTRTIDARFFGLLLMLRKNLRADGVGLKFEGISRKMKCLFRLNGLEYLLS
jgi:N-acetylglucosaminyldiphosphoundecaprenol N-acetyl-beta-D-mannosaminyltransferase